MTTRSGMSSGEPSATYRLDGLLKLWLATKSNAYRLADNEVMKLDVECYSGRKADERPVRFRLKGTQYAVEAVLDQWYDPESIYFKVRADDEYLYSPTTNFGARWNVGLGLIPRAGEHQEVAEPLAICHRRLVSNNCLA